MLTQTSEVPKNEGSVGRSGALSWREREVAGERSGAGEEERRPCFKRAVEINQCVYVLEEQSVPLAQEHSTVRFPLDWILLDPIVCVSVWSLGQC